MLKNYSIIKRISKEIGKMADEAAINILNDYSNLKGREEEITSQLRGEINRNLISAICQELDGQEINGCVIKISTFKKNQESHTGADLVGIIEINHGGVTISKAFLAQAKIGISHPGPIGQKFVKAYSANVLQQVDDMLDISSDSFVFIYSDEGIFCIPALQVKLANSNIISTENHPFHTFGAFFEEFFKCFIGDHLISPKAVGAKNLEDYAERLKAQSILKLSINLNN